MKKHWKVTIFWSVDDLSEGDYCTVVEAEGKDAALRAAAEEMLDTLVWCDPDEKEEWIRTLADPDRPGTLVVSAANEAAFLLQYATLGSLIDELGLRGYDVIMRSK